MDLNLVSVCAPTNETDDDEIGALYLTDAMYKLPKRETTVIPGDFNVKIGTNTENYDLRNVESNFGIEDRNGKGNA